MRALADIDPADFLGALLSEEGLNDFLKYEDELRRTSQWAAWMAEFDRLLQLTHEVDLMLITIREAEKDSKK